MIEVSNVVVRFGSNTVLNDITLTVPAGQIVVVMGSSGGGKTTLLRAISGLVKPTSGSVRVHDISVHDQPEAARRQMGMVFQSSALFDYVTVKENVLFGARRLLKKTESEYQALADELLLKVGLSDSAHLMPGELSGGMKKRVGMARALATAPPVMLYDEPTTGLDPITTYSIDQLIVGLRDELQVTSLVVSHDVSSVFRIADQIAFLVGGRLVFVGSPSEFEKSSVSEISELLEKAESHTLIHS